MGLDGHVSAWSAIVPVKPLDSAKSRISGERAEAELLAVAFLRDTLEALRRSQSVADIVVATSDRRIAHLCQGAGCVVVDDSATPGINSAVHAAAQACQGDHPVLALVSDLPALDPSTVDRVVSLAAGLPRSFMPDASGHGTTMWCAAAPELVETSFGPDSAARHAAAGAVDLAAEGGADLWRARQDVDTPEDLQRVLALGVGLHTRSVLDFEVSTVPAAE